MSLPPRSIPGLHQPSKEFFFPSKLQPPYFTCLHGPFLSSMSYSRYLCSCPHSHHAPLPPICHNYIISFLKARLPSPTVYSPQHLCTSRHSMDFAKWFYLPCSLYWVVHVLSENVGCLKSNFSPMLLIPQNGIFKNSPIYFSTPNPIILIIFFFHLNFI